MPVEQTAPKWNEETDVIEAARVLTGWRINFTTGEVYFNPAAHDEGNKAFSGFYNDAVIFGQTGTAGADELDDLIDLILAQDEVAKFIARKLYRWFVYYEIDETTEANVISPLADILRNNNYEIKPDSFL